MKKTLKIIMASIIALAMFFSTYQIHSPLDKESKKTTTISFNKQTVEAKGFKTGADGEKYLNDLLKGIGHKPFKTKYGKRVADVYVKKGNSIHESKVGYVSKTKFVVKQIKKDIWLRKNESVNKVKWHFFKSANTGKIGASKPLLKYLKDNKIPYEIQKNKGEII